MGNNYFSVKKAGATAEQANSSSLPREAASTTQKGNNVANGTSSSKKIQ